jgi:hypothetical protein
VQLTIGGYRAQKFTSVADMLSSVMFCAFKQDSPQKISVSADEVWNHAAYIQTKIVEQQRAQHIPQVEHLTLVGQSWLMDCSDTDSLPKDFPNACRG